MTRVSPEVLQAVRRAFADYRAEVEATRLADNSKDTYIDRAEKFVRWLAGDFEPGSRV